MSGLILPISIALYLAVPGLMIAHGWLIRASATMIAISLLPWAVWRFTIEGDYGPGMGFAAMITAAMLLLALVPLAIGLARFILRFSRGRAN